MLFSRSKHIYILALGLLLLGTASWQQKNCLTRFFDCAICKAHAVANLPRAAQAAPHRSDEVGYNFTVRWDKIPGAVAYEIEFFNKNERFLNDKRVYINGYNVELPSDFQGKEISWHVRALDFDRNPLNNFSAMQVLKFNKKLAPLRVPVPTNKFNATRGANLLYPVYNWIPVQGIRNYEVEILNALPQDNKHAADSSILLGKGYGTGFDWYDDDKRVSDSIMYWRVRGVDTNGMPLTDFSNPEPFQLSTRQFFPIATFGDSITHGGGSISYSPSDWEYSYQTYLDFDTVNLGQSGDTSASSLERFDSDVVPFHPKYLLIMTGSNSLRGWTSAAEVIDDLENIRLKCLQNNIKPVFLTLPPINPDNINKTFAEPTAEDWVERFASVNAYIRQYPHIELNTKFEEGKPLPTEYALDGLHLDINGKKLMAEAINEQLPKLMNRY